MTDTEIFVLEKGLHLVPIQNKINEPELKTDFEDFCRRMHIKWHFRNEPFQKCSEILWFTPKSSWKPPKGYFNLEVFLSQIEYENFKTCVKPLRYSKLLKDEWKAVRSLADDHNIVIKKADMVHV